jgi:hypothetical protein
MNIDIISAYIYLEYFYVTNYVKSAFQKYKHLYKWSEIIISSKRQSYQKLMHYLHRYRFKHFKIISTTL